MAQYEYQFLTEGSGSYINDLAAEAITKHALCYFDPTGNGWLLADADAAATMPVVGISMAAIPTTRKGRFLLKGFIGDAGWTWTPNGIIYASTTAGALTQTPPAGAGDTVQAVGIARTSTIIWFDPAGFGGVGSGQEFSPETAIVGFNGNLSSAPNYFLCDGTADEVQINQAIAYVGALGGGSVFLERGTYNLAAQPFLNQDDIKVQGQGWDTILDGGVSSNAFRVSGARCMLRDVQVRTTAGQGNNIDGVNCTGDDFTIENVYVSQSDRDGIRVDGARCKVVNCYIDTVDRYGVIAGRANVHVSNCTITNIGEFGVWCTDQGDGSVISNNVIDTTGDDGVNITSPCENCTITGNTILNWTNQPVDDDSQTSVVQGNNAGGDVLNSNGCGFATIQDAIDDLVAGGWVEVPERTFSEAVVLNNSDTILRGRGWDTIIDGGTTGHAIVIQADRCVVKDLSVQTTAGQGNAFSGVNLDGGSDDCRIERVRVIDSDFHGIRTNGLRTTIYACLIVDADNAGIIAATTGDDSIVNANVVQASTGNSIEFEANADNCIAVANRCIAGAIVDTAGTGTVVGNDTT